MRFISYNVFTILWLGVVLLLTLTPGTSSDHHGLIFLDKLVHFGLFFVLCLLMIVGFSKQHDVSFLHDFPVNSSLIITVSIGLVIELTQEGIVGRDFDWFDVIANCLGSISGVVMFYILYRL